MVKKVAYNKHISTSVVAKHLGISAVHMLRLYKKKIIHPKWIPALNKALEHDFWQYYADPNTKSAGVAELEALKAENTTLRKELAYLKEIVELLRKKKN